MLQKISLNPRRNSEISSITPKKAFAKTNKQNATAPFLSQNLPIFLGQNKIAKINTSLNNKQDKEKYEYLLNFLKNTQPSPLSGGLKPREQLEHLLKSGKLLNRNSNDNSSVLDNLYEIASQKRAFDLDKKVLILNVLDNISSPAIITQTFGDIPKEEKKEILDGLSKSDPASQNPKTMDVEKSGVCAAASCEVNLADKYPAEYARWVNKLSSEDMKVVSSINLSSLSKNPLEAVAILELMESKTNGFTFDKVNVEITADKNAYLRAKNQTKNWDPGERNVADVLIQSAIMQIGSQNTYNSLTDLRAGSLNSSPQGLIEVEKTYVESIMKNKEITSLVYQKIDDDNNLVGYNCSFDKIKKHIKDTIDSGDDVIIGCVDTNESSGRSQLPNYSPEKDGLPNKIINGHEITIVDYKTDPKGNLSFVCVDTDDNSPKYVVYSADWLIPRIHHAGYPAAIVEEDAQEMLKNEMAQALAG